MKILIVLVDGLGDLSVQYKNKRTPLQLAHIPALDQLAREGTCGLMDPVEAGLACGSDTAHLSLFGYDPRKWYRGRGAFESVGSGLKMEPGDIAFKSNFATIHDGLVTSRRADRSFEKEGPILCQYLTTELPNCPQWAEYKQYQVSFQYATEHRCGLRIRGPFMNDAITGTDPLKDGLLLACCQPTVAPTDLNFDKACFTSKLVNRLSHCVSLLLADHPINLERKRKNINLANCVLFRGAGMLLECPSFQKMHPEFGRAFGIAPTCMISGFLQMINVEVVKVEGATGPYNSNLANKAQTAAQYMLNGYDFGFLHVKAVDDAGHDKLLDTKVQQLEKVDYMVSLCINSLGSEQCMIVVTGDHSTPVEYGDHSCEPVPVVIAKLNCPTIKDNVQVFDEISVARGKLGRFSGIQLMNILKKML